MLRLVALVAAALIVAPSPAAAQPCDPYSSSSEAPIPRALRLRTTCGNGRLDTYATACELRVSGGCGLPTHRSTSCTKTREICDGRALGGQTCQALGYAGGALRCAATCDRLDVARCTLCLAPGACRERTVSWDAYQDVTLVAQGRTIRAFWYDARAFQVADIDDQGALGPPTVLAPMGSFRLVPMRVGTSALTIVGAMDQPQLSVVPATGAPRLVPLPGKVGTLFLPLLPVPGKALALAILGEPYDAKLVLVDPVGKLHPLAPVYGQNVYRRAALVPIAPGKHVVRFETYEVDVVTQPGDLLWLMHDYKTLVMLARGGAAAPLGNAVRTVPNSGTTEVAVDGKVIASFGPTEDVIGRKRYPLVTKPQPTRKLLAPHAYEGEVSIARTATREVHAARVRQGDAVENAPSTLAIAVGKRP